MSPIYFKTHIGLILYFQLVILLNKLIFEINISYDLLQHFVALYKQYIVYVLLQVNNVLLKPLLRKNFAMRNGMKKRMMFYFKRMTVKIM